MKIAYVIDNLYIGGAQKLLVSLVQALSTREEAIEVIVIVLDNHRKTYLEDEIQATGAELVVFPAQLKSNLLDIPRMVRIMNYLRRTGVQIVHTHLSYSDGIGTIAGWIAGLPTVATLHTTRVEPIDRYQKFSNWILRKMASRIIAVGESVALANERFFPDREIDVVPNAVHIQPEATEAEKSQIRFELFGKHPGQVIMSIGSLTEAKGYRYLLDAFAKLEDGSDRVLVIVGDGDLRANLETQVKELGLERTVYLIGQYQDASRLLLGADVYVNSSIREGLSLAILEAMAAGLPVVATSVGEAPYLISPDVGVLVSSADSSALATGLKKVLSDPNYRTTARTRARERVIKNYNFDRWVEHLLQIYRDVLGLDLDETGRQLSQGAK